MKEEVTHRRIERLRRQDDPSEVPRLRGPCSQLRDATHKEGERRSWKEGQRRSWKEGERRSWKEGERRSSEGETGGRRSWKPGESGGDTTADTGRCAGR